MRKRQQHTNKVGVVRKQPLQQQNTAHQNFFIIYNLNANKDHYKNFSLRLYVMKTTTKKQKRVTTI